MYSFDIFDTLITRSTADPKGIFTIMQDNLSKNKTNYGIDESCVKNFYHYRVGAEQYARMNWCKNGIEDITLSQIYAAMVFSGKLDQKQADRIQELELRVEYDNILPVHENIRKLKQYLAEGEKVVLISDMYLSAREIRVLLCKMDPVFENIPIYVSSELKKTKSSGNLYRETAIQENVSFQGWIHYGDNSFSDVKMPLSLGINAVQVKEKRVEAYEERLLEQNYFNALSQTMVGTAEYLKQDDKGEYERIGISYGGPIIYSYVNWILEKSLKEDIDRLYFIARDGWILKKTADFLIESRKLPIKTEYIYGSRKAWRMASIYGDECNFEQVLTNCGISFWKGIDDIAELLQISRQELLALLPEGYKNISEVDSRLFSCYVNDIIEYITTDSVCKLFLLEKHKKNRELVRQYLSHNIDLSDEHFAFVELSGSGYTQVCLANIIRQIKECNIRSFFLQMDGIWDEKNCDFYIFCPNAIRNHYIVEMLCRAPHGQTEGYKEENGKIVPILEEGEGDFIRRFGYDDYVDGVLAFVTLFEEINFRNQIAGNVNLIHSYLDYVAQNTGSEVQRFFENMPFSTCGVQGGQIYAPPLTRKQLKDRFFWNELPMDYSGASLDFAMTHIPKKSSRIKECYIWLSKTPYGKWRMRKRHNHIYCLYGRQKYYYPKGLLKGKIVLYAAGKVGQDYYKQMKKDRDLELVAWTDSNYSHLQEKQKALLIPPEKIRDYCFDVILIAVLKQEIFQKIEMDLIDKGIDKKQIAWMRPLVKW